MTDKCCLDGSLHLDPSLHLNEESGDRLWLWVPCAPSTINPHGRNDSTSMFLVAEKLSC